MLYDREQRVTDPVCGMSFKVERAAARAEYEGKTYYFCAHACHRQFKEEPAKYTGESGTDGDEGEPWARPTT